jgi:hypothetical protein
LNLYQLAGLLAVLLTLVSFAPYVIGIRKGVMKPHVFSWVIWSISTAVVFFAQLAAEGGAGAWATGVSATLTLYVTWLAWRVHADTSITRSDWLFLWSALAALPVWYVTADPLWSVVILTSVDVLGFGPTLRKLYRHPYEESIFFYLLFAVRSAVSIVALEARNLTTVLFPAAMVASCLLVCVLLWVRRRVYPRPHYESSQQ